MPFVYAFGALKVSSPFTLPGLLPFRDDADRCDATIRVFIGKESLPEALQPVYRWSGRYGLSLWSQGKDRLLKSTREGSYLISDEGTSIACYPDSRSTAAGVGEILVRRVLPRIAQLHGAIALHAASLSDGRGAYLLLGPSGAGKSTLSAALARELGWRVLSDDHAILYRDSPAPVVSPAATGVCLWQDSLAAMALEPTCCQRLMAYKDKFWYADATEQVLSPRPIQAFLFLAHPTDTDRGLDHAAFKRIAPREAVIHLMRQLIRFDPTDMSLEASLFKSLGSMAEAVPAYAVSHPRGYGRLPGVVEQVKGICCQASGAFL